jgi:Short-chain alcohol dehydrogenase of unknown specificity
MGSVTARVLAERGWHVLGLDQDGAALNDLCGQIGARFTALPCDVRSADVPAQVLQRLQGLPQLDGLVNMVGVSRGGPIDSLTDADWDFAFDVNVTPAAARQSG